jgi:hypothetical protein
MWISIGLNWNDCKADGWFRRLDIRYTQARSLIMLELKGGKCPSSLILDGVLGVEEERGEDAVSNHRPESRLR